MKKQKPVKQEIKKTAYQAIKGDAVDEMFQAYMSSMNFNLRISRLGGGFYMFGTKKIYAKIMNNKLVVRVGGGFMGIEEFISTYGESELLRSERFTVDAMDQLHAPAEALMN